MEALLRRERAVVAVGLGVLALLAWVYIWRGAGMGMTAPDMTVLTLFPHAQPEPMPGMVMPPITWMMVLAMWWAMMIAMMTPSAAPLILLYGRASRHASAQGSGSTYAASLFLAIGYLAVWFAFAALAALLQYALQRAGLISQMMLWSQSALLSTCVLVGAGAYQLSPLKHACLQQCRGPVQFLTRHWRPGRSGAFVMGMQHGAWCVGCCWVLMLLLFVGGVMNIAWIALLTLLVMAEKLAPRGPAVSRVAGAILIVWGLATLLV